MGHEIKHYNYPESASRKKIEAELASYVEHACWQEGGQLDRIRWLDNVEPLASYEDALQYISQHDKGWYDCLAVRYRVPSKETAGYKALLKKSAEAYQKLENLRNRSHFADAKSSFIGCGNCGSKISREHLLKKARPNFCPVCNADLRPKSTLDAIARADAAHKRIVQQVYEEKRKLAKKGSVRWLVKIEFHQ